jgi:hypothetical protein
VCAYPFGWDSGHDITILLLPAITTVLKENQKDQRVRKFKRKEGERSRDRNGVQKPTKTWQKLLKS